MPRPRLRTIILVGLAVVGVGGIAVTAGALRTYDQATRIDRSVSSVVVREYVDAELVRRDDSRAALYSCDNSDGLAEFRTLRAQLEAEEKQNNTQTEVVPAGLNELDGGKAVDATLTLNQGSGTTVRTRIQYWKFTLVDEDGWRVCGATRLPDPSPTPSVSGSPSGSATPATPS